MRHNTFIDPKMNTLNNLPYLPTEIWDKIFDIKYSLDDKESMKKHNRDMVIKGENLISIKYK